MENETIPSYKKPPVIEVVWSVQFSKLPWLTAAHTGLFWDIIRKEYPRCEEQAPIERKDEPKELLQPRQVAAELLTKPIESLRLGSVVIRTAMSTIIRPESAWIEVSPPA